jgi:hypothetical protein
MTVDPSATSGLSKVGPITFDPATFKAISVDVGTVVGQIAHPPTGQPSSWLFTLIDTAGEWKIVDAKPAQ